MNPGPWPPGEKSIRLKRGGVYLITGGLGGVGLVMAEYLAKEVGAALILTSRTELPPREQWEQVLANTSPQDSISQQIRKVKEIEELGTGVMVLGADAADPEQMREVVTRAEQQMGPITGIIHCAALTDGQMIQQRTRETSERIFRPKITGTLVLDGLFKNKALDFFVLCSSLNSILPAFGQAGYCAANAFLDAFTLRRDAMGSTDAANGLTVSIAWDRWLGSLLKAQGEQAGTLKTKVPRPPLATPYEGPENNIQQTLSNIWSTFFGYETVGIRDDFFELGGDSLKAITLTGMLHKAFNTKITLLDFFNRRTIKELALYITGNEGTDWHTSIVAAEKKDYYILSPAQKRLYILQQMEIDGINYNMPVALPLNVEIDKDQLVQTFTKMMQRHESLRTSFEMIDAEPVQVVHPPHQVTFEMGYYETDEQEARERMNHFVKPFDLSRVPLLRVDLIKIGSNGNNGYTLLVDMHHIIMDGVSQEIFTREFMALYRGEELPLLSLQYKDYAQWQNSEKEKESKKKQEKYWLKEFAGEVPILNLPLDYQRPPVQSFAGGHMDFTLNQKDAGALKALALETDSTLYMLLLAIFNVLPTKLSANEDIVVGIVTAGRRHANLQQVLSMFVSTLALRNYPRGKKTFREFLKQVKKKTLEAFKTRITPLKTWWKIRLLKEMPAVTPYLTSCLPWQSREAGWKKFPKA